MCQYVLQASRFRATTRRAECCTVLGILQTLVRPLEHISGRLHEVDGAGEHVRPRQDVLAVVAEAVAAHGAPRQSREVATA